MLKKLVFLFVLLFAWTSFAQAPAPLRVFIRGGTKDHGPGQHDHPRFLAEWKTLLQQRGAVADGSMEFPTADQLQKSDVLILFAADAGKIGAPDRANLDTFLKRGGGMVVLHDGICGDDAPWFKTIVGGAWEHGRAKFFEGDMSFYYQDARHPITEGASNFDLDDELYYDLHMMPEAKILATSYAPDKRNTKAGRILPSVYETAPQMWVYEKDNYRAFVCLLGHNYKTFGLPQVRAVLLRGIAWAGKRDVASLVSKEELASLRYPEGGPTAPEKSGALLVTHPDFVTTLVAAEPLVQKPLSMDWDASGRLWVAEAIEYPAHTDKSVAPGDRISILEDTRHDGVYNKKTLFYTNLNLVTSLVLYKDGVIVSQAPDIYFIRDTNGDGAADKKEVLYTGLGTSDAHAVLSNMRWGLDGWIYATVGYSRGDIASGDGKRRFGRISDGVVRFKPDGSAFEQYSSKGSNTWGVDQAADGEIYFSQANGNHINHVVVPESLLGRAKYGTSTASFKTIEDHNRSYSVRDYNKQAYVQIDFVGGFTAAAGAAIYEGGAWPEKWNRTFYVSEPTVNLVHQDMLNPNGPTYLASKDTDRKEQEFLAGKDLWFRPVHQRVGPDGALYVLDFYNQAAVHNDTRGPKHGPNNAAVRPDRDHYFGRIWRVQHKDAKKLEVPDLSTASNEKLISTLSHPNMTVRMIAQRLLVEKGDASIVPNLRAILTAKGGNPYQRLHALWIMAQLESNPANNNEFFASVLQNDEDAAVRKNAAVALYATIGKISVPLYRASEPDPRVRLLSIVAQSSHFDYPQISRAEVTSVSNVVVGLLQEFQSSPDAWTRSAILAVADKSPATVLKMALLQQAVTNDAFLGAFADHLTAAGNSRALPEILFISSNAPEYANRGKIAILQALMAVRPGNVRWTPEIHDALAIFLKSSDKSLAGSALPLALKWDIGHSLQDEVQPLVMELLGKMKTARDSRELISIVQNLGPAIGFERSVMPAFAAAASKGLAVEVQKAMVAAVGDVWTASSAANLLNLFPSLHQEARDSAIMVMLRRSDGATALLDALRKKSIDFRSLSPLMISIFKTNRDPAVQTLANQIFDELRGPDLKEKNELIARFTPLVVTPGNVESGKKLFTANCAVCHKFKGEGKDLAPDLTGMGAHGPGELIVHILDPNRVVEPNFVSTSIETLDDQSFEGIVSRADANSVLLRNASGDTEVKRTNIKTMKSTGRSLMPEGFEALGGDGLRDILTYIGSTESQYRIIDLREAFDANSTRGIYQSVEATRESLEFKKFGLVKVGNIPFEIVHPSRTASGNNVLVMKGGSGLAKTFPQSVEVSHLGIQANRLHFLGGVGGWAFPCCGADNHMNLPAAKISVKYGDGAMETFVITNGVEIADYNGTDDVPGSRLAEDLVTHGQVRWFTRELKHNGILEKISIESFNNFVAATFVAITADSGEAQKLSAFPAASTAAPIQWGSGLHTLIVGGGSSHDFEKWFHQADQKTIEATGQASVHYTSSTGSLGAQLKDVDVLYLSNNQPIADRTARDAILHWPSDKGMLLVHPALWYNWNDWPEYNAQLVGGGAHSHDAYGEFEVTIEKKDHPVTLGVPEHFRLKDELYHFEKNEGANIEILATGKNLKSGASYPLLWIVHPKDKSVGRIVCLTLGHDAESHDNPAYRKLLQNAVLWAGHK